VELYAALDLGTNSCRMLIAQPKGAQFHVIDSFSRSVGLGQGLEASGRLSEAAMRRAIAALRVCRRKLGYHRVRRMRLVTTEACRRASNGTAFMNARCGARPACGSRSSGPRKRPAWPW
jgi:exopolyphosphatase/guanosine-5'-triphosphate,3'-diphosphate pyrophosphatase